MKFSVIHHLNKNLLQAEYEQPFLYEGVWYPHLLRRGAGVELTPQVSMVTVLFEGVFEQILLKMAKNDHFLTHFFNFASLPPPHISFNFTPIS